MLDQTKDTPGVIAPPPLIFLSGLVLGWMVHRLYPVYLLPPEYLNISRISGVFLIISGLAAIITAKVRMQRAKTNIEPWKPTTAIITDGIYSYTRNPVYIAMVVIFLGVELIFNSLWFAPFLVLVLLAVHYGVILREERYLENKFGEEYLSYKRSVRRWI